MFAVQHNILVAGRHGPRCLPIARLQPSCYNLASSSHVVTDRRGRDELKGGIVDMANKVNTSDQKRRKE